MPRQQPLLSATGLRKSYGRTVVLDGGEIAVAPGEIVAVMGESAFGTSTLLHCLSGIVRPDEGEIRFDGRSVTAMGDSDLRHLRRTSFGFVSGLAHLVPTLTCRENTALPLRLLGRPTEEAEREAMPWLERMGVADLAGLRPEELSDGECRRVAIARTLALSPRVIFADEPTGALDRRGSDLVMELFTAATVDCGIAVVLATLRPRVADFADREIEVRGEPADLSAADAAGRVG
ncbi:ABC transporter ATP-binding protein [Kitasatospora terrestris]|uniref:ABC transporter ATP-binding protein n=1 Tax=Kitasatospora terrestris TaxID=258051 RepID=A0ABP9DEW0_9ACTN